jgi:hypothetical protein
MKTLSVNVAPSSTRGHFVKGAKNVIELDKVTESFYVEGDATLSSENHTTLDVKDGCLITCQVVFDPLKGLFEKSRD